MASERDNETCEPCGECTWCANNFKARADAAMLKRSLRAALRRIERMAVDLEAEATHYEKDPHARTLNAAASAGRRVVRTLRARWF